MQKSIMQRSWRPLILVICGALTALGYAPYNISWLPTLLLAIVLFSLQRCTLRQTFLGGWLYGTALFGCGISWVRVSIEQYGGMPGWATFIIMALLSIYLGLFPALSLWGYRWLAPKRTWSKGLVFASCWVAGEWLRGHVLTGFPWLALGYSQTDGLMGFWAPVVGVFGISWLLALSAAWLMALVNRQRMSAAVGLGLIALATVPVALHSWITPTNQQVAVSLVQGNIEQSVKWQPNQEWPTMVKYRDLSKPLYDRSELIIWPESAIPAVELAASDYLHQLDKTLADHDTALVTGIIDYQPQNKRFYNDVIVLGRQNRADDKGHYQYGGPNRYAKHHLLPIGEFVPFGSLLRTIAPLFNLPMSDFSRGAYIQPNLIANGWHLLPALCYEIAFADQVRANFTKQTDFLLTVSNDTWFGDSNGPLQHMQIARMRAKELGRALLRGTNNGVTAVVDAYGHELARLPRFKTDVLNSEVPTYNGMTPFYYLGHWPTYLLTVFILGGLVSRRLLRYRAIKRKRSAKTTSE